jgi:hypothetical protein
LPPYAYSYYHRVFCDNNVIRGVIWYFNKYNIKKKWMAHVLHMLASKSPCRVQVMLATTYGGKKRHFLGYSESSQQGLPPQAARLA